ncbi:MAG: hypothetical protein ACOZB3_06930 [Calditrichota bacterium]
MTARERFRRRLCVWWWTVRKGRPQGQFHVPHQGLHPQHLVIIMPPEFAEFEAALPIVNPVIERLQPVQATIIARDNFRSWLGQSSAFRLVTFDLNVHGWLGFPKSDLLHRMSKIGADVVLDLTSGFHPFTNGLAAAIGAPLRISFDVEPHHDFHNYVIRVDASKPLSERYRTLLGYV